MEGLWKKYLVLIEDYLEGLTFKNPRLEESVRYSLLGGGKRIRPVLTLAASELVKTTPTGNKNIQLEHVLPAATALELIHTYSLIHDDLPAMDNDDFRRGKPSNHIVYGEGHAILTGDALLTYAFELLAKPLPLAPELQLRVIREVAEGAGEGGMIAGQVADMAGEGKKLTLEEIEHIHNLKTGALLKTAVRIGAILAGGTEEQIEALTQYGASLGLAFQIKDDILDIESDSETLGKPAGSDLKSHKATYPSILGLEGSKAHLAKKIEEAKRALDVFGGNARFLHFIADFVAHRQH